ncbi:sulfotransferase family 2 domain-containing protein [Marinobacter sp. ATCH36]|uniref:sulfotransferase family 2 domain-containing protein n=1 Tax=Marinobacter sp. ATCH36 TaxID=2945106 RepID=UPI0020207C2C|nr:sulfotransferase family protein [Marinobacter sp. ATCH36]
MPIFSKDEMNILFIHIPKSAGSSIERIGSDFGWRESFSVRGESLQNLEHYKATLQHLHAEPLESLLNPDKFDAIFTIVRNPFSRLKSEYYWQRSQRITDLSVTEWINDTFERYSKNHYLYDNHIRPQTEFLLDNERMKVFKLEDNGIDKAKKLFIDLSYIRGQSNFVKRKFFSRLLPERQEKRSVKDRDIETEFNKHYNEVVDFYKEDFSFFSYDI